MSFLPTSHELLLLSIFSQIDFISSENYPQDFSVSFLFVLQRHGLHAGDSEADGNFWVACTFLQVPVKNRHGSLKEESCRHSWVTASGGWGSCPWWLWCVCVCEMYAHTHTHHSDRWPIEIISELFCGCYDNQCSLGFHLAMWQGLWRQLEAESVAESAQSKACENLVDAGCCRSCHCRRSRHCCSRCCFPGAAEHGLLNPALLLCEVISSLSAQLDVL